MGLVEPVRWEVGYLLPRLAEGPTVDEHPLLTTPDGVQAHNAMEFANMTNQTLENALAFLHSAVSHLRAPHLIADPSAQSALNCVSAAYVAVEEAFNKEAPAKKSKDKE